MKYDEFQRRHNKEGLGWALFLLLEQLENLAQQNIMTSIDRLTAAVTANTQAITDLTASVDAAVVDINAGAAGDAALDALSGAVEANNTNLAAQQARLDAAVAAVTPPAPTSTPTPTPAPTTP